MHIVLDTCATFSAGTVIFLPDQVSFSRDAEHSLFCDCCRSSQLFKKACNPIWDEKGQVGRRHLAAVLGRHKACPYGIFEGEADLAGGQGRHKACPYGSFEGRWGRRTLRTVLGRHKACPYGTFEGEGGGDAWRRAWAGTRPAPTGLLRGRGRRTLWTGLGRHKACPYGTFEGGGGDLVDGPGQAQGRPYGTFEGDKEGTLGDGTGQAQGLPLRDF